MGRERHEREGARKAVVIGLTGGIGAGFDSGFDDARTGTELLDLGARHLSPKSAWHLAGFICSFGPLCGIIAFTFAKRRAG